MKYLKALGCLTIHFAHKCKSIRNMSTVFQTASGHCTFSCTLFCLVFLIVVNDGCLQQTGNDFQALSFLLTISSECWPVDKYSQDRVGLGNIVTNSHEETSWQHLLCLPDVVTSSISTYLWGKMTSREWKNKVKNSTFHGKVWKSLPHVSHYIFPGYKRLFWIGNHFSYLGQLKFTSLCTYTGLHKM